MSSWDNDTTLLDSLRRRRFSAEEIRRQPEFRALLRSLNKDKNNNNEKEPKSSKSLSNATHVTRQENSSLQPFRSRSYTVPCRNTLFRTTNISERAEKAPGFKFRDDKRSESGAKHDVYEPSTNETSQDKARQEEYSVIFRKNGDMGIAVVKKAGIPTNPKEAWHNPDEKTSSRVFCHKITTKKRHTNARDKDKSEMTTLYEESIGDHTTSTSINVQSHKAVNEANNEYICNDAVSGTDLQDPNISLSGREDFGLNDTESCSRPLQTAPSHDMDTANKISLVKEEQESEPRTFAIQTKKVINSIHFKTRIQEKPSQANETDTKSKLLMRQTSTSSFRKYDAKLEKSAVYLRSRSRNFTRATQCMEMPKSGLRQLNVHYSKTNSCHNDRIIFTDLLKHSHIQNAVVADGVFAMERRLYNRRHEKGKCTTFYDRFLSPSYARGKQRPQSSPLPHRSGSNSPARTVADKNKERRERIHKKEELIEFGYAPRMTSLETKGPEVIEDILLSCRHLRVKPDKQPWLYAKDDEHEMVV